MGAGLQYKDYDSLLKNVFKESLLLSLLLKGFTEPQDVIQGNKY